MLGKAAVPETAAFLIALPTVWENMFPILVTVIVGLVAPDAVALIGFLMFGNLIRECGVLESLSETAQKVLANLITILLGISIASRMGAEAFLQLETLLIMGLGFQGCS